MFVHRVFCIALLTAATLGLSRTVAGAIVIQPDESASKDAFIYEGTPSTNYQNDVSLGVSNTAGSGHDTQSLIQFDLSSIASGSVVSSAKLHLYVVSAPFGVSPSTTDPIIVGAYLASGSWDESTVTWNTKPGTLGGPVGTTAVNGVNQTFTWDITSAVQTWLDDPGSNNGLLLAGLFPSNAAMFALSSSGASAFGNQALAPSIELELLVPEPATAFGVVMAGMLLCSRRVRRRSLSH